MSDPQPDGADGHGSRNEMSSVCNSSRPSAGLHMHFGRGLILAAAVWIVVLLTWRAALKADFVFDDVVRIMGEERLIVAPWDSWRAMVAGQRPLVQLSLGMNHYLGGLDPRGYHAFNMLVHATGAAIACLVALCCIQWLRIRKSVQMTQNAAYFCAFSIALLWSLHPLQTAAATYVIQRAESMAGLFTLTAVLCLCGAARWSHAPVACARQRVRVAAWGVAVVGCCLLAMAAKPTAASTPALLLAIDVFVVAGSFRAALRARWFLHAALWATTLVLIPLGVVRGLFASAAGNAGAGLRVAKMTPWDYACLQVRAVGLYMGEVVCPWLMSIDHGPEELVANWTVVVGAATLTAIAVIAAFAVVRGAWWGILPIFFALALAPTSSFVPLADVAADHRMYLPLYAVMAAAVAISAAMCSRARRHSVAAGTRASVVMMALLLIVVAAEAFATSLRNQEYADPLVLWGQVIERRPTHVRARINRAGILMQLGRDDEAQADLDVAAEWRPQDPLLRLHWGILELHRGHAAAALELFTLAAPSLRHSATLHGATGEALRVLGQPCVAAESFQRAVELSPSEPRWRILQASSRAECGDNDAAAGSLSESPRQ